MKTYRIAKAAHIEDLTGEGARISGGRWNEKGIPVIYTAENLSLAAFEYLVHLPLGLAPPSLMYITYTFPDDIKIRRLQATSLPPAWDAMPFQDDTVRMGSEWARSNKTLLLRVPSVVVPGENNYIINPRHAEFKRIKIGRPLPFIFDDRVLST